MAHTPVLLEETVAFLAVRQGGRYVDGTLGRAGHAKAVVALGGEVLGIDRDDSALEEVGRECIRGLHAVKGRHGDLLEIAKEFGWNEVDGIMLDLGVSSPQLDEAGRGFSFMREGPLDMRMDASSGLTAADLVNGLGEDELCRIFRELGEEPRARRVAGEIARERASGVRFETTLQLARAVEKVVPRSGGRHPATRVFQALRMEVNDELGELERALGGGLELLRPGGRLAVIAFESISDRTVKKFFAAHAGRNVSLQQGGWRWEGERPRVSLVTRRPVVPGRGETEANFRARSAKLRVAEKAKQDGEGER